jgi:hypothetical protein
LNFYNSVKKAKNIKLKMSEIIPKCKLIAHVCN